MKKYALLLLIIASCFFARPAHAGVIIHPPSYLGLQSNLVGCWGFDGGSTYASDCSGNNSPGTIVGPVKLTGKLGEALSFDGVDDYVSIPHNAQLSPNFITVSVWLKPVSVTNTNFPIVVNKGTVNNSYLLFFGETAGDGHPTFRINTAAGSLDQAVYGVAPTPNIWTNFVGTYDGVTIRLYQDGREVATKQLTGTGIKVDTGALYLGNISGNTNPYQGVMDDVRIYNRAFSASEVARIYRIGLGSKANRTESGDRFDYGLVGHWTFDGRDISGTRAKDSSGFNNHGTLTNGPFQTLGRVGQALVFDGSDDYVNVLNAPSLVLTNRVTLTAWAKRNAVTGNMSIVNKVANPIGNGAYFLTSLGNGTNSNLRFGINDGTETDEDGSLVLKSNQWYFLAGTWDGSNMTIYVNGVQDTAPSAKSGTSLVDNGANVVIGQNTAFGVAKFNGIIDDVRIYNRSMSAGEIKRLYDIAQPRFNATQSTLDKGLVGHWTFDGREISGTTAKDRSGSNGNGTIAGGALQGLGRIGQGLVFDGGDDCVSVASVAPLQFAANQPNSVSMWIKTSTFNRTLLNSTLYYLYIDALGRLQSWMNGGLYSFNSGLADGRWHHVVYIYDGTAENAYYDTVSAGTPNTEASPATSSSTYIGCWNGSAEFVLGNMDDVRIYNRALTRGEINKLYQMGR